MPLTDEYYEYVLGRMTDLPLAKRIVYNIVNDLRDRRGIRHEWDQVDSGIQEEILQTLIEITEQELTK